MESLNKFLYYIERFIYYLILLVGLIGIYEIVISGEPIQGGAIGVLIMGSVVIADYFNLSREGANIIFNSSLSLLMLSLGIHLIKLEGKWYKILGTILISGALYFLITLFV